MGLIEGLLINGQFPTLLRFITPLHLLVHFFSSNILPCDYGRAWVNKYVIRSCYHEAQKCGRRKSGNVFHLILDKYVSQLICPTKSASNFKTAIILLYATF